MYNDKSEIILEYRERINANPDVMLGKPVIKGTRITVELILRKMSEGMTKQELLEAYPGLAGVDIYAALSYSAELFTSNRR